jgi:hypothetical protein
MGNNNSSGFGCGCGRNNALKPVDDDDEAYEEAIEDPVPFMTTLITEPGDLEQEDIDPKINFTINELSDLNQHIANMSADVRDSIKKESSVSQLCAILAAQFHDEKEKISLTLNLAKLTKHKLNEENVTEFTSQLATLTSLSSLKLNFEKCLSLNDPCLMKISESLGCLTNLNALHITFSHCNFVTHNGLTELANAISKMKQLKTLELNLLEMKKISNVFWNNLSEALMPLEQLNSISLKYRISDISLTNTNNIQDENITNLCNMFTSRKITSVSLDFKKCGLLTTNGLTTLFETLSKLTFLTSLKLYLTSVCSEQPKNDIIAKLGESIINLKKLTVFHLDFGGTEVLDAGFLRISNAILLLPRLTSIRLTFKGLSVINVGDYSMISLSRALLNKASRLTYLSLNFSGSYITDQGITTLSQSISKLTSLQTLRLIFRDTDRISDSGLRRIASAVQKIKLIKHLTLKISCSGWTSSKLSDRGLSKVGDALTHMKQLETLTLLFSNFNEMKDDGLQKLGRSIAFNRDLTYIDFNFGKNPKVSDEGVTKLVEDFGRLNALETCKLNFQRCEKVTNNSLIAIGEAIKRIKGLEVVDFRFNECLDITDNGLIPLVDALGAHKKLQSLALAFHSATENKPMKLSNQSLIKIGEQMQSLPNLTGIDFNFIRCESITDHGLIKLSELLKNSEKLESLKLAFDHCDINDESVSVLGENIAKLEHLTEIAVSGFTNGKISEVAMVKFRADLSSLKCLA